MNLTKKFKLLYLLSLIPLFGFFIAWVGSWIIMQKETKSKKYVFIHYFIWIIPLCVAGGIVVAGNFLTINLSFTVRTIILITACVLALYIMAFSCVYIAEKIVYKFNEKVIN